MRTFCSSVARGVEADQLRQRRRTQGGQGLLIVPRHEVGDGRAGRGRPREARKGQQEKQSEDAEPATSHIAS